MATSDNPWLSIPLADYLGHMGHPRVGQLAILREAFAETLGTAHPTSVLVLGCTDGNGLDCIDPRVTRHVTAVDINPGYLENLRDAHGTRGFELTTTCADAMQLAYPTRGFDLIYAGLILEYLAWESLLPRLAEALTIDGRLSVVIQVPSVREPAVSATPYTSLLRLEPIFSFVQPAQLDRVATSIGLKSEHARLRTTASGKQLACIDFRRAAHPNERLGEEG